MDVVIIVVRRVANRIEQKTAAGFEVGPDAGSDPVSEAVRFYLVDPVDYDDRVERPA